MHPNDTGNKTSEFKIGYFNSDCYKFWSSKDLNSESNLLRQPLTLINKLDTVSNLVSTNTTKPFPI